MNKIRKIKKICSILVAFALSGICANSTFAQSSDSKTLTNAVAAVVDDQIITLEQVEKQIKPLIPQVRMKSRSSIEFYRNIELLRKEVLQSLVDKILIIKEFEDNGYMIPQTYLDQKYSDTITEKFGNDRSAFLKYLQEEEMTIKDFKKDLKDEVMVTSMFDNLRKSYTQISPKKIKDYYEANKSKWKRPLSADIEQISINDNDPKKLSEKANKIKQDLLDLSPEKIKDYADKNNLEYEKANRKKLELAKSLDEAVFSAKKDTFVGPIILGTYAFVFYVDDILPEGYTPVEEVQAEIEWAISGQSVRKERQRWLEKLRKKAYIKYNL